MESKIERLVGNEVITKLITLPSNWMSPFLVGCDKCYNVFNYELFEFLFNESELSEVVPPLKNKVRADVVKNQFCDKVITFSRCYYGFRI